MERLNPVFSTAVQPSKFIISGVFLGTLIFSYPAFAQQKRFKCSAQLAMQMQRLQQDKKSSATLSEDVETAAKKLEKALRSSESYRIDPEEALLLIHRSFRSSWDVPDSNFKKPLPFDNFAWGQHKNSLERLQAFFHGHVEYVDLRAEDFSVGIRIPSGVIDPIFFDNAARQIFENLNYHLEVSLAAFAVFKEESKLKRRTYPLKVKELAREMAVEYQEVTSRMPTLSAMALQFFCIMRAIDAESIQSLDSVQRADFDLFIERDSSYRMLAHNYLKVRKVLEAYNNDPEIRREIRAIQSEESR